MRPLKTGDIIGVVSPASSAELSTFRAMERAVQRHGFRLRIFGHGDKNFGRMAATDELRLKHLRDAFQDPEVGAILCARGGYGSGRLLNNIDRNLTKDKIFVGYSDITNLLLHFNAQSGIMPFHGPMVNDFVLKDDEQTLDWFFSTLKGNRLSYVFDKKHFKLLKPGRASGQIWGGNISIIETLIGTDSLSLPENTILFLEDVNEFMYAFDRALVHLERAKIFENASAIVFADLKLKDGMAQDNSLGLLLEEVLDNHFGSFNGPIAFDLPFGHTQSQMTIPLGATAEITVEHDHLNLEIDDFWDRGAEATLAA